MCGAKRNISNSARRKRLADLANLIANIAPTTFWLLLQLYFSWQCKGLCCDCCEEVVTAIFVAVAAKNVVGAISANLFSPCMVFFYEVF
jgi:hypothetical protein